MIFVESVDWITTDWYIDAIVQTALSPDPVCFLLAGVGDTAPIVVQFCCPYCGSEQPCGLCYRSCPDPSYSLAEVGGKEFSLHGKMGSEDGLETALQEVFSDSSPLVVGLLTDEIRTILCQALVHFEVIWDPAKPVYDEEAEQQAMREFIEEYRHRPLIDQ